MEATSGSHLPGAQLRAARERAGISDSEMAARLHLSVSYVRALEADNYAKLPEATFIRGYIRNYAREVGLPGDDLANLYSELNPSSVEQEPRPLKVLPARPGARPLWIGAVVLLLLALLGWFLGGAGQDQAPAQEAAVEVPALENSTVDAVPLDSLEQDTWLEPEDTEDAPLLEDSSVSAMDVLEIRFAEDCWIRIRDAQGVELYAGQRAAGSVFRQEGTGPFRITFGDASAVASLRVNDAPVELSASQPGKVLTIRVP